MSELSSVKVVVTRSEAQYKSFAQKIRAEGATPIKFPVIAIAAMNEYSKLDFALQNLNEYDWWIFTSANAVNFLIRRLEHLSIDLIGVDIKIATVGPKTAHALEKINLSPDFIPEDFQSDSIFQGLGDLKGKRILLTRAEIARQTLPEMIRSSGGAVDDIPVYRTVPAAVDKEGLREIQAGVEVVTFASSSAVTNFIQMIKNQGLDPNHLPNNPVAAVIGPVTAQTARENGIKDIIVAEEFTTEGLIAAIKNYWKDNKVRI